MNRKAILPLLLVGLFVQPAFADNEHHGYGDDDDDQPGYGHTKITICHKPGTHAQKTLTVDEHAKGGHLKHGDSLGACSAPPVNCISFSYTGLAIRSGTTSDPITLTNACGSLTGLQDVPFSFAYGDPSAGTAPLKITDSVTKTQTILTADTDADVPLTFADNKASFTLNYADAGQLNLQASIDTPSDDDKLFTCHHEDNGKTETKIVETKNWNKDNHGWSKKNNDGDTLGACTRNDGSYGDDKGKFAVCNRKHDGKTELKVINDEEWRDSYSSTATKGDCTSTSTASYAVTVSPYIQITAVSDDNDATSLNSVDAAGTAKWKAGKDFRLSVMGITDPGVTPVTLTHNYKPGAVNLTVALAAPKTASGGSAGTLLVKNIDGSTAASITATDAGASGNNAAVTNLTGMFADGALSKTGTNAYSYGLANYSEVGVIQLSAEDTDYLGQTLTADPVTIGRFIPDHFSAAFTTTPTLQNANGGAGGFTYMDQAFTFSAAPVIKVNALNAANQATRNYTGNFWKLQNATLLPKYINNVTGMSTDFVSTSQLAQSGGLTIVDAGNGTGTVTIDDTFTYKRRSRPQAPFDANITLQTQAKKASVWTDTFSDSDAVCNDPNTDGVCDPVAANAVTGAHLLFGRLNLDQATGSQDADLHQRVFVEFYTAGKKWAVNTLDNYTKLDTSMIDLSSNLEDPIAGISSVKVGATSDSAVISTVRVANPTFISGENELIFTKTGTAGYVDTGVGPDQWLKYDWNGDGIHNDNPPSKRASFGVYSGQSAVKKGRIFIREVYDSGAAEEENLNK